VAPSVVTIRPNPPVPQRPQAQLKEKEANEDPVFPYSRTYGRTDVTTILGASDGGLSLVGRTLRVGGWVRTGRVAGAGAFAFLEVNDGSCFDSVQCMVPKEVAEAFSPAGLKALTSTGTSVLLEGQLAQTPEGTKQAVELKVSSVCHLGPCDGSSYPMAKKKQSMEFLREKIHLRPRTNTIGAVARIRNALAYATHMFFQQSGFKYVHTPIITCSDCEGAGEMFQVSGTPARAAPRPAPRAPRPAPRAPRDLYQFPAAPSHEGAMA